MSLLVTSFFTSGGVPATGLSPTIRIWEVTGGAHNLVIGAPNGSSSAVDGVMTELIDAPSMDGFYKFDFTAPLGFSDLKTYVIKTDGGIALPVNERFQSISKDISVLEEASTSHLFAGTIGEKIAQTKADTTALVIDVNAIQIVLDLIRRYDTNRTKIDTVAKTLTIFDDDCTTVLRVFELFDSTGTPSVTSVCERVPVAGTTDGFPVCP